MNLQGTLKKYNGEAQIFTENGSHHVRAAVITTHYGLAILWATQHTQLVQVPFFNWESLVHYCDSIPALKEIYLEKSWHKYTQDMR